MFVGIKLCDRKMSCYSYFSDAKPLLGPAEGTKCLPHSVCYRRHHVEWRKESLLKGGEREGGNEGERERGREGGNEGGITVTHHNGDYSRTHKALYAHMYTCTLHLGHL